METPTDELLTPMPVARLLNVKQDWVMRRFSKEPGVLDLTPPEKKRPGVRRRRFVRIPRSVLERFMDNVRLRYQRRAV